jgi:hypothetical protein
LKQANFAPLDVSLKNCSDGRGVWIRNEKPIILFERHCHEKCKEMLVIPVTEEEERLTPPPKKRLR